jgi:hypothetical protein
MERKIGEGHVAAMARLGLKELRNTLTVIAGGDCRVVGCLEMIARG